MDVVMLSRLQFAVAVFFHFIFVPLTLGLSVIIALMETRYVRTGDEFWKKQAKFWGKLFVINFTLGVVTGITLEFQFGTNWSRYSEYVGDIFGSLLAIEATVAFFLESTFLAVWHFGWNRVGKKMHLASIWFVAIAGNLSALWIILANGFMQNPVGYYINEVTKRAELASFYDVVTNPYGWGMFVHTILASWVLGGFFVLGVSSWHLLRGSQTDFFRRSFRMVAPFTLIFALLLALSGDQQGKTVAKYQPAKLAAMEAHWETQTDVPFYLLVWPDPENETNTVQAIGIPGLLSWIAYDDVHAEVKGLKAFAKEDRPPVLPTFLTFRTMVALGGIFLALSIWAFLQRKKDVPNSLLLKLLVLNIPLPYIGLMVGWAVTEIGRQPWIVYNLMRTTDAVSPVPADNVLISLIAFIGVYSLLGILDIYLLRKFAIKARTPRRCRAMLETIWFVLWALLWAMYFILDGFDLGMGTLLPFLGKNETERRIMYNAAGPFWDGNEVWLIAAGGVTFAAFPKVYAVMFSALYAPLLMLLFALIFRAVSFEFRSKVEHDAWRGLWDCVHFVSNLVPCILLGVAFANLFMGIPVDAQGVYHGNLLALLNVYGLAGGVFFLCMFVLHGSLWLAIKSRGDLQIRAVATASFMWPIMLVLLVAFLILSAFYTKLFDNYLAMPILLVLPLLALAGLVGARIMLHAGKLWCAWAFSALFILGVTFFGVVGMFPGMIISSIDPAATVTAFNGSSSQLTLKIMLGVALVMVPIVLLYQFWMYRLFSAPVLPKDLDDEHAY